MKPVLYGIIVVLSAVIITLTNMMIDRPYNSSNMRSAYFHGCNIGLHGPLTGESVERCARIADGFKTTIDDLMEQDED